MLMDEHARGSEITRITHELLQQSSHYLLLANTVEKVESNATVKISPRSARANFGNKGLRRKTRKIVSDLA
jgi:hypothetical protein